jgi:hypothetical protein
MWLFFCESGNLWNRGPGGENLDATGLRPVHTGVDSSGLLPDGGRATRSES